MGEVTGTVHRIVFQDAASDFHIFRLQEDDGEEGELLTVKGRFVRLFPGQRLSISGDLVTNRYGIQLEAREYRELRPLSRRDLVRYLSSGFIKGVGPAYAEKIVTFFGEDTLDILSLNPQRLLEIPGIGKKKLEGIRDSYAEQQELREVMLFLHGLEISTAYALRIYRRYGKRSREAVEKEPYRLADEVPGIGFHIADRIALRLGYEEDSIERMKAALLFTLKEKSTQGHVYLLEEELLGGAALVVKGEEAAFESAMVKLLKEKRLIAEEGDRYYLPFLYEAEEDAAREIARLMAEPRESAGAHKIITELTQENERFYSDEQIQGIELAIREKFMFLTGGPGTGKTTTVLGIIRALQSKHYSIVLAAPTGRAAKRLGEVAGQEALTIHRLLEYNMESGFQRNRENPLETGVYILDEASMIDILLFSKFLEALPDSASLILVGDVDQLPAVGPGNVLKDIIASGKIPGICLTEIFRQAATSKIIQNAHLINRKELPEGGNKEGDDFFLIREGSEEKILKLLEELVLERLPKKYGLRPQEDIQILVPMKKGLVGTKNINGLMQGLLHPEGGGLAYGDQVYKKRDKVMQVRNNYEKRVFNGDIGEVEEIANGELLVNFDGNRVPYDQSELDELQLAYAITIHKSQGSEYEAVILPLVSSHFILLDKNLLYTAVTRAKKLLILIGEDRVIRMAVKKETARKRNTYLTERILKTLH